MVNTPDNKRRKSTKTRLARAYLELIQKKKASEISVSELCKLAHVNRTTFYNIYDNTSELACEIREEIIHEYAEIYRGNSDGHTAENYLKMLRHVKENQILYKFYFLLSPDSRDMYGYYDEKLARATGKDKLVDYHVEFFAAGFTAILKKWLDSGCKESPEEILEVLKTEYGQ